MAFIHSNDPAMSSLGYQRAKLDFYPTPAEVTTALIPFLHIHYDGMSVWEPATGNGAMSAVLTAHGYQVRSTDIKHYGYVGQEPDTVDFLASSTTAACIVSNPPYAEAEAFLRQSIKLTKPAKGVTAMLLRHEYDCAAGRNDLFNQPPFCRKITLLFRPRWIPDTKVSPRFPYAWFVWSWAWTGEPVLSYAKRDEQCPGIAAQTRPDCPHSE
jgi:hypothetical protein